MELNLPTYCTDPNQYDGPKCNGYLATETEKLAADSAAKSQKLTDALKATETELQKLHDSTTAAYLRNNITRILNEVKAAIPGNDDEAKRTALESGIALLNKIEGKLEALEARETTNSYWTKVKEWSVEGLLGVATVEMLRQRGLRLRQQDIVEIGAADLANTRARLNAFETSAVNAELDTTYQNMKTEAAGKTRRQDRMSAAENKALPDTEDLVTRVATERAGAKVVTGDVVEPPSFNATPPGGSVDVDLKPAVNGRGGRIVTGATADVSTIPVKTNANLTDAVRSELDGLTTHIGTTPDGRVYGNYGDYLVNSAGTTPATPSPAKSKWSVVGGDAISRFAAKNGWARFGLDLGSALIVPVAVAAGKKLVSSGEKDPTIDDVSITNINVPELKTN